MSMLSQWKDRIRTGGRAPVPMDWVLGALTPIQHVGMAYRLRQTRGSVDAKVIAFGNLTVGGTGKTPGVIERAAQEVAAGNKVAVVSRGYGSARINEPYLVLPEDEKQDLPRKVGDELALVRKRVPEITLVKSGDRMAGAHAALELGCNTIILDDAFQAVRLERDENICVIDASNPFGNGSILPRGILREKPNALARATALLLTHCEQCDDLDALKATLQRYAPGVPMRCTQHGVAGLWRVCDGESISLDSLKDTPVHAACGIAHPEHFVATLEKHFTVQSTHFFDDHQHFEYDELGIDGPLIVTEKDAVKMVNAPQSVYALAVSLEDFPG